MPAPSETPIQEQIDLLRKDVELLNQLVAGDTRLGLAGLRSRFDLIEAAQATQTKERDALLNQVKGFRMAFALLGVTNLTTLITLIGLLVKVFGGL